MLSTVVGHLALIFPTGEREKRFITRRISAKQEPALESLKPIKRLGFIQNPDIRLCPRNHRTDRLKT